MTTAKGRLLLSIARAAISTALGHRLNADHRADWLQAPGACFVTLSQYGALRGCIGSLTPYRSLLDDIRGNAVSAALHDTRFMPLQLQELEYTDIEVSLLSAVSTIDFFSEADALSRLCPNVDGVIFEFDSRRSTFLPQVWEALPETESFMRELKRKAGLPGDFWSDQVKLSRYTVEKFRESNLNPRERSNG